MGSVDQSYLITISDLLSWRALAPLLIAMVIIRFVALNPRQFWPMLIIAGLVGCGPKVGGYLFLDEFLSGAVVLGALLRISLVRSKQAAATTIRSSHVLFFNLWIGYMLMESVVGVIYNDDLRIIRWILFYAMFGIIGAIVYYRGNEFPFPSFKGTSLIIVITTVILYIGYLGQGMYFDSVLGLYGRYLSQDMIWAGSAYAVFPTLVAAPAAFYLVNDPAVRVRILAWSLIAITMGVAFYFSSRITWLVLAGCFVVFVRKFKVKAAIAITITFFVIFSVFMTRPEESFSAFVEDVFQASQAIWSPGESDINRNLQLRAGLMRVTDNPKTFLIGDGIYSHRFTVIPYVEKLYRLYLPDLRVHLIPGTRDDTVGLTIFHTVGFTALLIDTGLIGMLLFLMNYLFIAMKLFKQKVPHRASFFDDAFHVVYVDVFK